MTRGRSSPSIACAFSRPCAGKTAEALRYLSPFLACVCGVWAARSCGKRSGPDARRHLPGVLHLTGPSPLTIAPMQGCDRPTDPYLIA